MRPVDLPQLDLPEAAESIALEPRSGGSARAAAQSTVVGLFKAQARRVRSFLRRPLRSDGDAQDPTPEGFLRLWRRGEEGPPRAGGQFYISAGGDHEARGV